MIEKNPVIQVVYTNKAHCRDCHRCLRVCPVKAIRLRDGQAYVVPERCIACGTCVRECPQGAKQYIRELDKVKGYIDSGDFVAVSLAPSFAGLCTPAEQKRIAGALRRLGFRFVAETATGAYHSAAKTAEIAEADPGGCHICSACPTVVSYVEKYQPEKAGLLVKAASPMVAHGRHLKAMLKDRTDAAVRVVFIGPCIAKKAEAMRPENVDAVDAVLTYEEMTEWFDEEGIKLINCEESRFDESPEGEARRYPLLGGSIKASAMDTDILSGDVVSASGFEEVRDIIESARADNGIISEPMFCRQGCVNGPGMPKEGSVYERRQRVLDYAAAEDGACSSKNSAQGGKKSDSGPWPGLETSFTPDPMEVGEAITEEQIQLVFESTGKALPEDRLDCGACGYDSCRDKAIAVIRGYAEPEMCMPYVKRLAERRTDKILETSPNGIVMLDSNLRIISMNPAFRSLFMCTESLCGKHISYLMDPEPFEQVASGLHTQVTMTANHTRYGLTCFQIIYALPKDKQYVGIIVDVTRSQANKQKLDQLREKTIDQARQLMEHQIRIAQTMAKLIGESTAQGEALVEKLVDLAGEGNVDDGGSSWMRDMYTTK